MLLAWMVPAIQKSSHGSIVSDFGLVRTKWLHVRASAVLDRRKPSTLSVALFLTCLFGYILMDILHPRIGIFEPIRSPALFCGMAFLELLAALIEDSWFASTSKKSQSLFLVAHGAALFMSVVSGMCSMRAGKFLEVVVIPVEVMLIWHLYPTNLHWVFCTTHLLAALFTPASFVQEHFFSLGVKVVEWISRAILFPVLVFLLVLFAAKSRRAAGGPGSLWRSLVFLATLTLPFLMYAAFSIYARDDHPRLLLWSFFFSFLEGVVLDTKVFRLGYSTGLLQTLDWRGLLSTSPATLLSSSASTSSSSSSSSSASTPLSSQPPSPLLENSEMPPAGTLTLSPGSVAAAAVDEKFTSSAGRLSSAGFSGIPALARWVDCSAVLFFLCFLNDFGYRQFLAPSPMLVTVFLFNATRFVVLSRDLFAKASDSAF